MYGIFNFDIAILFSLAYNKNESNEHNEVHSEVFLCVKTSGCSLILWRNFDGTRLENR